MISIKVPYHNQAIVHVGELTLYFSYETCVAFQVNGSEIVCSENVWSNTTGKFIDSLCPDRKARYSNLDFEQMLGKAIGKVQVREVELRKWLEYLLAEYASLLDSDYVTKSDELLPSLTDSTVKAVRDFLNAK